MTGNVFKNWTYDQVAELESEPISFSYFLLLIMDDFKPMQKWRDERIPPLCTHRLATTEHDSCLVVFPNELYAWHLGNNDGTFLNGCGIMSID